MAGKSAPRRRPLWRRMLGLPGHLWCTTAIAIDVPFPRLGDRPRFWLRAGLFCLLMLLTPVFLPLAYLFADRLKNGPIERVRERAIEVWRSGSPEDSLAIVREVHDMVAAAGREGRLGVFRRLDLPPFGRFGFSEQFQVYQMLYEWLFQLERYEQARALAASQPAISATGLQQVDCLLALYRKGEAVRLLEASLHLDTRDQELQTRLDRLAGTHVRGLN